MNNLLMSKQSPSIFLKTKLQPYSYDADQEAVMT